MGTQSSECSRIHIHSTLCLCVRPIRSIFVIHFQVSLLSTAAKRKRRKKFSLAIYLNAASSD